MMNKHILKVMLFLVVIFAIIAIADVTIIYQDTINTRNSSGSFGVTNQSNISSLVFFNVTVYNSSGSIVNASGSIGEVLADQQQGVTNITFRFFNSSDYGLINTTITNTTRQQAYFKITFDTTTLSDGTYSVDANMTNASAGDTAIIPNGYSINGTTFLNFVIDNTLPVTAITSTNSTTGDVNVTPVDGAVFTHLNAFNQTLAVNVTDALTGVWYVNFSFANASVQPFNLSGTNKSGTWEVRYNLSKLRAGSQLVTVVASDFARSRNTVRTYTFTLNTPMNLTPLSIVNLSSNTATATAGQNFTLKGSSGGSPTSNVTFNVSIQNNTQSTLVDSVILSFNNASGNDFNITANVTMQGTMNNLIAYYVVNYNVSMLKAGDHTVWIFSNDSLSNVNRTESFTFTVNTPMNVTSMVGGEFNNTLGIEGKNFTGLVYSKTFNVSVQNSTAIVGMNTVRADNVILMFNTNATAFNRTMSASSFVGSVADGRQYFTVDVNLSGMSDGHHTVTVFANDTWGNLNKTENISFTIDSILPTVSVSCSPSSVAPSGTVTCDCTASDGTSGLVAYSFGDGRTSETPSTATVGEKTSSTCTATDYAGHVGTATGTYTVASSGGGGGVGGAGGGSSSGATGQFEKKVWTSINAGETAAVSIKNGAIGVTEVSFGVPSTVWGAWVQVSKKEALPKSVTSFTGKVYRNLEITKGPALKDELVKDAKVEFKVEKAWLLENKLPKEAVALHRYTDGAWVQLTTRLVALEDEAYVHYVADTPGFSYFVIGGKVEAVPSTEAPVAEAPSAEVPVAEAPSEGASVGAELKKLNTAGWVVALVVAAVLVAAVLIYLKKKR